MGLLKTDLAPQTTLFLITAFIQIPIYTGLGAYVLSQRPRHPINWAFAGFCATNVISLAGSVFMIGLSGLAPIDRPLPMRMKWAVVPLFGTFLFHLYSFYFPQEWQRGVRYVVRLIYAAGVALATVTLFTDRVVAGLLMKETAIHPNISPGPLFTPLVLFNSLLYFAAAGILVYTYFASTSQIRRRHIRELLLPLLLIIVITFITVPTLFSEDQIYWMTRLNHVLLLITAIIYGRNILQYGHFVGRPQSTARLIKILVLSFLTFMVATGLWLAESWLSQYMPVRLPLLVLLVMVIIIAALPELSRAFSRLLRRLYYSPRYEHHEQIATNIAAELEKVHDPAEIQKTLLQEICATLSASGGFVAYRNQETSKFRISITCGPAADATAGDELYAPPFSLRRPKLLSATASWLQEQPIWQAIVLVSPIFEEDGSLIGFMALGERKNGRPYYYGDITYCEEVCRRLAQIQRMASLLKEHEQVLQEAEEKTTEITKIQDALDTPPIQPKPALKIYTLGPLKVELEDNTAVDREFNSEKVKSMLALLLLRGEEGATRDELATTLWPDHEPDKVDNVFHVTLHKLRRTLEPNRSSRGSDYVIHKNGRYQLNFSQPIWLDVVHFEQLMMSAEAEDWREAVALYRGDYLQGLRDEMPIDIQYERRRLESLYESGLRHLVDCLGPREGYDYLLALHKQNQVDERINKELISHYIDQDQLPQARQQVAQWRRELERMGIPPSTEILDFWRQVENGNGKSPSSD